MKIIENTCGRICPIIAEKDHEIACLKLDLKQARVRLKLVIEINAENEKRVAKARQALLGITD